MCYEKEINTYGLMKLFRKIKTFLSYPYALKCKIIVAYFTLLKAYWLIRRYPLEKLVLKLKKTNIQSNRKHNVINIQTTKRAIIVAARYTLWRTACYEQAIAAILLLKDEDINVSLYIGTRKEEGKLAFHAWTTFNDFCITGGDNAANEYEILSCF